MGEPVMIVVEPFGYMTGFARNWETTIDVSSPRYVEFSNRYTEFFTEAALKAGQPASIVETEIFPELKNAYFNGEMLPFFRTLRKIGISVDDLKKKDVEITGAMYRSEE
jgi:hypothetical protein